MILVFTFALVLYVAENCVICETNVDLDSHVQKEYDNENGDLLFVQLLFRHGDRTPLGFYENDPWKDKKYWDDEPGQLTELGKQQQFELGMYMRNRYSEFLNSTFSENDIYVQSSHIHRTIISAEIFLTGLFTPEASTDFWNTHLPWQPIPVHTTLTKFDILIHAERQKCDAYNKTLNRVLESEEIKEFNRKHKDLYDYLSLHSGEKIEKIIDTVPIRDTLFIENVHNKSLPEWTKKVFPGGDLYDSMEETFLKSFSVGTSTPLLAKIKGGFILKEILDRFTNKSKSILDPDRKLWVYSGHDTTICRLLNTLGILKSVPNVSACVMFEMRNIDNVPHIQIFLKDLSKNAVQLHIPNCGLSCPLTDFYVLYKDVLPTKSFEEECIVGENENSSAADKDTY